MLEIRLATEEDFDDIWRIFRAVVEPGDTYTFGPETTWEQARDFWLSKGSFTFVAVVDETIRGAYLLKPNQPGLGSHVANAAFIVDPTSRGLGLGEAMGRHSLTEAIARGFLAMQFNFVVSTNEAAVWLWTKLGFAIVGTLPGAFRHARLGFVDAFVMYRSLSSED
jgi:ribosomal protein S18 acetylase RimI-like enzyme